MTTSPSTQSAPVKKASRPSKKPVAAPAPATPAPAATSTAAAAAPAKKRGGKAAAAAAAAAPVVAAPVAAAPVDDSKKKSVRRKKQRKEKTHRLSGYIHYCKKRRPDLKASTITGEKPSKDEFVKLGNLLGAEWRAMSAEEKQKYNDEAAEISKKNKAEALAAAAAAARSED